AFLDHLLFLLANTLQQDGCRFIVWVLRNQLATDGKVKHFFSERAVPTQPTIRAAKAVRDHLDYLPDLPL
ncbi:MAG: hypothetical protein IJF67_06745, partial [Clostridia bacterium]|nr:hypothetical protein [Clostridia bacterium]